jgi:very-short-patch-repair endonuclease
VEAQRNLVNVAVSRARRALVVVGDAAALAQLPVPTLTALAVAAAGHRPSDTVEEILREDRRLHSQAERRLHAALLAAGLTLELKPQVDGYELDFAIVTPDGRRLDVECDGSQHIDARGRQRRQDLARDHVLGKLGWQVLRYPAWRCLTHPAAVAAEVAAAAGQRQSAEMDE